VLSTVERVLILKGADLLREAGPRQLLPLADVAREVELLRGEDLYREDDRADALYLLVEGRVRLETNGQVTSEIGPGEAFGTWALVDDSERGHRAICLEDGLALALHRDEFYDVAARDLALLQLVVRALARRLRELVSERPDEARVEAEGKEEAATAASEGDAGPPPASAGAALEAAVLGQPAAAADVLPPPVPDPLATADELASETKLPDAGLEG
jgi:CRP-like cAMP-binding protein